MNINSSASARAAQTIKSELSSRSRRIFFFFVVSAVVYGVGAPATMAGARAHPSVIYPADFGDAWPFPQEPYGQLHCKHLGHGRKAVWMKGKHATYPHRYASLRLHLYPRHG